MAKVKNTVPVYDICSLGGTGQMHDAIMAERFADYLLVHPNLHRAHGHSFYHLVLFTGGGGGHTIDFRNFRVQKGQAYFMAPGQVHSWSFEGSMEGYVINFSEDFFRPLLADEQYLDRFRFWDNGGDNTVRFSGKLLQEAIMLMEQILLEYRHEKAFSTDRLRLLLLSFFILAARAGKREEHETTALPRQALLHRFRTLLNEHYRRYKLPRDYAMMLHVTPNYLNALCRELLGKPAGELIRERVLLEARRLLVNSGGQIAETAYELGFSDNSYFSKFFRKYTGITPEVFKTRIQQHAASHQTS